MVGVDDYSDYPPEAKSRAKVGGGHHANLERIVALQPDFVVALVEQEEVDALVARGIPAVKLFPKDFEGVLHTILLLGEVTGTDQRAQQIVAGMKGRIDQIEARVKGLRPPRVFLELDGTDPVRPFTAGPHSFIGDMIRAAGGWNIAHDIHTPSSQISLEAIVEEDPEIIVLTDSKNPINPQSKEDVLNRRGWAGITAVRKGAVIGVDNVFFFVRARGLWTGSSCWLAYSIPRHFNEPCNAVTAPPAHTGAGVFRIVSLAASATEILFALGAGDRLVGVSKYCDYPEQAQQKPRVGSFVDADYEAIQRVNPDIVLTQSHLQRDIVARLIDLNINVLSLNPVTLAGVVDMVTIIGRLVGCEVEAASLAAQMRSRIEAVRNRGGAARA